MRSVQPEWRDLAIPAFFVSFSKNPRQQIFLRPAHHLFEDIFSVVGTADERPGEHPPNAKIATNVAEIGEFIGMIILLDFGMFH